MMIRIVSGVLGVAARPWQEYLHTESGRLGRAACPRWETVPPAE